MTRRFTMNTTLVLPQGVQSGPGATNMRLAPGETLELEDERCQQFQRFINGRLRAGDMTEIVDAPAPAPIPDPEVPAGRPFFAPKGKE